MQLDLEGKHTHSSQAMAATDASVISDPRTSESIRNHLKFFAMKQSSLNFFLLFSSGQKKL